MKVKAVSILLALCLMLGVYTGAWAAPGDSVLFPPSPDNEYEISVQSLAAVGDTLYMLTSKGLYSYKANDAEPRLISDKIMMRYAAGRWEELSQEDQEMYKDSVNLLLESSGKLYGLNTAKGSLLLLSVTEDGVDISETNRLDWKDMYIQESDYVYIRQIFGAALMEDRLYLLTQQPGDNWDDYDLLAFDLISGAQTKLPAENVRAITPYENGRLLCNVYDRENMYTGAGQAVLPTLSVLDPAKQTLSKLADFPAAQVGGLCYSSETGMVYVLGRSVLFGSRPGSAFETIAYMPVDYPGDQIPAAVMSGGFYAAMPNYGAVYVRNTDPAYKATRVLRIAGGYSDSVSQAFQAAHPEIPVLFTEGYFRGAEQIAQHMVSGSDSADLIIVGLSYGGFTSLRDKGYVGDLSQNAVLNEAVAKMYPQYIKEIFRDGKLIAFPYRFNANGLGYSPELLKEMGIEEPPKTLFDLIDLYVAWVEEYSTLYPNYTLLENVNDIRGELLNQILVTYLAHYARTGEDLKFDTPIFKSLLNKLDEAAPILEELNPSKEEQQGGRVYYSSGDTMPASLMSNYFTFNPVEYNDNRGYLPLPLALDEGMEPAIFGMIEVFVMNPNSKNQDLVQTYMEFFAQNMPRDISITFCPDDNAPVEYPFYAREIEQIKKGVEDLKNKLAAASPEEQKNLEEMLKSQEEYLAQREANRFSITEKMIAQYRSLVPYVCIDTRNLEFLTGSQEVLTILQRFMQGEMETQQFVREFDRKLQMMRMENR